MAQPPIYQRNKDFTVDYSNETDHSAINGELDGAATSINAIRTNLALIQRDDGGLKNAIVTADNISAGFSDALAADINTKLGVDFAALSLGQYFKETFLAGVDYTGGTSTQITLAGTPSSKANTTVHFDGVLQHQTEYELAANVITFDAAIPSGVVQVEVGFANTLSEGLIGDGAVNTVHLNDAVFNGLTQVTAAADDYIPLADTSNSGDKRKALLSSVLAQIPAGTVTNVMLADSFANDMTNATANILDSVVIADASDSGNKKKATVQSILDQQPAGSIGATHLVDSVVTDLTAVTVAAGDSVFISDVSDGGKKKRALVSGITSLIIPASATPLAEAATGAVGSSAKYAREDHIHPQRWMPISSPVLTTSGSSVSLTSSVPLWVRRITLTFSGVSTNGTAGMQVQIGDIGGLETTGYVSSGSSIAGAVATSSSTSGFIIRSSSASASVSGVFVLQLYDVNNFIWSASHILRELTTTMLIGAGDKALSAVLDRVSIVTTDTFDGGAISVSWE